jgi:hypothetical protein
MVYPNFRKEPKNTHIMSTLKQYFIIGLYCLFGFFIPATAQTEIQGLFDNESPIKMALSGTSPQFFEDPSKTPRRYARVLPHQDPNGTGYMVIKGLREED